MWDLIVSVPNHCLSFYFVDLYDTFSRARMKAKKYESFSVTSAKPSTGSVIKA